MKSKELRNRADGMVLKATDGRGNTTITQTDLLGRTVCVTDATGAATSTRYDAVHDLPSVITDAIGNTTCYRYDQRGRKTVEWSTGIQPAVFTYDDADRLSVETLARGLTRAHRCEHARGLLLGTAYSDGTTPRAYQYNHLGQLVQVTDDAGTRTIG